MYGVTCHDVRGVHVYHDPNVPWARSWQVFHPRMLISVLLWVLGYGQSI